MENDQLKKIISAKYKSFFCDRSSNLMAMWFSKNCTNYSKNEQRNFRSICSFIYTKELPHLSRQMECFLLENGFTLDKYLIIGTPLNAPWETCLRILSPSKIAFVVDGKYIHRDHNKYIDAQSVNDGDRTDISTKKYDTIHFTRKFLLWTITYRNIGTDDYIFTFCGYNQTDFLQGQINYNDSTISCKFTSIYKK